MKLYHSSNVIVESPDTLHSRNYLDFGRGFYLTSLYEQAVRYAQRFKRRGQQAWLVYFPDLGWLLFFFVQVLDKVGSVKPWNWLLLTIILFLLKLVDCIVFITIHNNEVTCFSGIRQEFWFSSWLHHFCKPLDGAEW